MVGWGVKLLGFSRVMNGFDDLINVQLEDDVVWVTGSRVPYAVYQEFGTSKMAAQPFLFPAAREAQRNIGRITQGAQSVEEAVKLVALWIEGEAAKRAPVGDTGNLQASVVAAPASEFEQKAKAQEGAI